MKRRYIIILLTGVVCERTLAFTYYGHDIIEAHAYMRLLSGKSTYLQRFPDVSGKHILDTLIAIGVLSAPDCWVMNADCDPDDPLRSYPVLRSGDQDFLIEKQFSIESQPFHFLSLPEDVYHGDSLTPHGVPYCMLDSAYPRCIRFLTAVFNDMLANPRICCAEQHSVYVLMHCIADSYSAAHVERDTLNWAIRYIKPWQASSWVPFLFHWSGWQYFFSEVSHSFGFDWRDLDYEAEWVRQDMAPYAAPWITLTPRAKHAVYAIEDLLVTIYAILRGAEAPQQGWDDYIGRNLNCGNEYLRTSALIAPRAAELEFAQHTVLGAQYRTIPERGQTDVMVAGNLQSEPLGAVKLGFGGGVGVRSSKDYIAPIAYLDLFNYEMSLSEGVSLTFSPFQIDFVDRGVEKFRNIYTSYLKLDIFPAQGWWLRFEGPRYSYFNNAFTHEVSVSVGRTFGVTSTAIFSDALRSITGKTYTVRGDAWQIPDTLPNKRLGPPFTQLIFPIGAGFRMNGSSVFAMYELVADRNFYGMRIADAVGFYVRAGISQLHSTPTGAVMFGMLGGGPELRFKLPPFGLPILVMPCDVEVNTGPRVNDHWDIAAQITLPIDLGAVEIAIDLLRYSYRKKQIDQPHFPAGCRIGFSYHESHLFRLAGF